MEASFLETMLLTFKVSFITTFVLFFISVPLAYYLAFSKSALKPILETIVSMPLVLPPSVLGFYLLVAFSPQNAFGAFLQDVFHLKLVFSFEGLIVGSIIFSLPFMTQPIIAGFSSLNPSLMEASYTLGKSKLRTLWSVLLPNIRPSLLSGIVVSFAHTIGEFGVVMMIGGNIAGETRVASIAIYDEVESLNYTLAHQYAFTLFVVTFSILLLTYSINRRSLKQ